MYGRQDPRYYPLDPPRAHPLYPEWKVNRYPSVTTITSILEKYALVQWAADCAVAHIKRNRELVGQPGYTALSVDLEQARFAYKAISEEAMGFGTDLHEICAMYLAAGQLTSSLITGSGRNEQLGALAGEFAIFCEKRHVKPIALEQVVYGEGYAGRLDMVWEIDSFWMTKAWCKRTGTEWWKDINKQRVRAVCDFKTGKGTYYPDWGLQAAAYRMAYSDERAIKYLHGVPTTLPAEHHGILKFNKETLKVNYKDYSPFYDRDLRSFYALRDFWWLQNEGKHETDGKNSRHAAVAGDSNTEGKGN